MEQLPKELKTQILHHVGLSYLDCKVYVEEEAELNKLEQPYIQAILPLRAVSKGFCAIADNLLFNTLSIKTAHETFTFSYPPVVIRQDRHKESFSFFHWERSVCSLQILANVTRFFVNSTYEWTILGVFHKPTHAFELARPGFLPKLNHIHISMEREDSESSCMKLLALLSEYECPVKVDLCTLGPVPLTEFAACIEKVHLNFLLLTVHSELPIEALRSQKYLQHLKLDPDLKNPFDPVKNQEFTMKLIKAISHLLQLKALDISQFGYFFPEIFFENVPPNLEILFCKGELLAMVNQKHSIDHITTLAYSIEFSPAASTMKTPFKGLTTVEAIRTFSSMSPVPYLKLLLENNPLLNLGFTSISYDDLKRLLPNLSSIESLSVLTIREFSQIAFDPDIFDEPDGPQDTTTQLVTTSPLENTNTLLLTVLQSCPALKSLFINFPAFEPISYNLLRDSLTTNKSLNYILALATGLDADSTVKLDTPERWIDSVQGVEFSANDFVYPLGFRTDMPSQGNNSLVAFFIDVAKLRKLIE